MPDINLAKDFDTQLKNDYLALGQPIREDSFANFCENKAVELYDITNYLCFVHAFCFLTTAYREIYEVGNSNFASFMKGIEVSATMLYSSSIIMAVNSYTGMILIKNEALKISLGQTENIKYPPCSTN